MVGFGSLSLLLTCVNHLLPSSCASRTPSVREQALPAHPLAPGPGGTCSPDASCLPLAGATWMAVGTAVPSPGLRVPTHGTDKVLAEVGWARVRVPHLLGIFMGRPQDAQGRWAQHALGHPEAGKGQTPADPRHRGASRGWAAVWGYVRVACLLRTCPVACKG